MSRDYRFDTMRVMATAMVVLIHIANYYCREFGSINQSSYFFALTVNILARASIPFFFMISGANLLSRPYDPIKNRKRIKQRLISLAVFTAIFCLWDYFYMEQSIHFRALLNNPERKLLWFLYAILAIYVALPFIKCMVDNMGAHEDKLFVVLWLCFTFLQKEIGLTRSYPIPLIDGTYYLGYFLLGYLILKYKDKLPFRELRKYFIMLAASSFALTVLLSYLVSILGNKYCSGYLAYSDILMIIASVSSYIVLYFSLENRQSRWITELSRISFGIYLTHGVILDLVMTTFPFTRIHSLIGFPLFFVLIFGCSGLLVYLLKKIRWLSPYL